MNETGFGEIVTTNMIDLIREFKDKWSKMVDFEYPSEENHYEFFKRYLDFNYKIIWSNKDNNQH